MKLGQLEQLDQKIFSKINSDWTFAFGDWFFPLFTDIASHPVVIFLLLSLLAFFLFKRNRIAVFVILGGACAVFAADNFNHFVLKPFFERPRPEFQIENIRLLVASSSSPSFPSSHAMNSFVAYGFFLLWMGRWQWLLLIYAGLIAYSRVYIGVHFPLDVLAGSCIGIVIGLTFSALLKAVLKRQLRPKHRPA